ncbi:Histidine kinase CKI1 [Sesamum alatum]|uniref:histidine kinase n=1 Tax=Sesamum alatum TaxID=300844 RepID=A0AAE1XU19_9LAMI|nr:Histidine kinase CKI1 [Sesamum alatum]
MQMLVVLSLASLLIPLWINRVAGIENEVKFIADNINQELLSGVQRTAALFSPVNASTINLVRILKSSLDEHDDLQLSKAESMVGSTLFQALSTIPNLRQISYIRLDGLLFAYYTDQGNQPYALYSNSTFFSTQNDTKNYTWYVQPVDRDTGKLYGEAIKSAPSAVAKTSWFQEALKSTNGCASVGTGWANSQDLLLLSTASLDGGSAVSLGYSMKSLTDFLVGQTAFYNGSLYLATKDGNVLTQGIPNTSMILADNQVSFQLLGYGDDGDSAVGKVTCQSHDAESTDSTLSIWDRKYVINCSPVEIAGLQLVYVLALPHNGLSSLIHKNIRLAFVLLILMIGAMVITTCTFVYQIVASARREMYLCGALINQMEATQQSERKSMNKSLAFATASHDVRASLAGITGLIEICRNEVSKREPLQSELLTNLLQMEACTRDLLGILNSILDTSKIEAGKMQLEEEEFDMEQLLEDVVDLYHPVGMKKGVDVILDPYDGSITKCSHVKGDRGKLKQILNNLLSNAVKFTSEGHVTVRAWARKPSLENEILASNQDNSMSCVFCLLFKIERSYSESEIVNTIQGDPNGVEFVFEVNDTGKGIPKEKQKSIFENYVQVKETALGLEGTGLGLGIVQSLVRLMGGEIGIVDKEFGERGTCFRFNVFFNTCETDTSTHARAADIEATISGDSFHHSGPILRIRSPKIEGSQVILFVQSDKRSTILQSFMQRLGIKVHVVKQHQQLSPTLKRIKRKLNASRHSSSGKSEGNSRSDGHTSRASSTRSKEVPLSTLDGVDNILPSLKKPNAWGGTFGFILVVIDTSGGPFREISRAVAEFRMDLNDKCCTRVVWLDRPDTSSTNFQGLDEDKLPTSDLVITKPFHGSRLYETIRLLPEFGGMPPRRGQTSRDVETINVRNISTLEASTSYEAGKSDVKGKFYAESSANRKPLMGKKILVADDDPIGRKIAAFVVSQLGANIVSCENGEEAWRLVYRNLINDGTNVGASKVSSVPFDCILMDCQMPVMDGIEATRRIREAEKRYGVHTTIIALTAHDRGEEMKKMIEVGVDGYVTKPLNTDNFLKAIPELIIKT